VRWLRRAALAAVVWTVAQSAAMSIKATALSEITHGEALSHVIFDGNSLIIGIMVSGAAWIIVWPWKRRTRCSRIWKSTSDADRRAARRHAGRRKIRSKDLADAVGVTEANLSLLKSGKVKGVRFGTLEAICRELDCQPGDLLEYESGGEKVREAAE
jgi:putative transcriptional regulator